MTDKDDELAFVFPGQGSQAVGMLGSLAESAPEIRATFDEASSALDFDLWALSQNGPAEALNRTEHTQPALLAAGVGVWRAWRARGGARPSLLAGHSLGEYTALVAAGSLDFVDAVRLVAERGRQMQRAVPEGQGTMAAIIGLSDETVAALCETAAKGRVVSPANYNAPGQVVVAGESGAVEDLIALARNEGAKRALALPVSVPSHCALMEPAADGLRPHLEATQIDPPRIRILHNVDVSSHDEPQAIREALLGQIHGPVLWTGIVEHMAGSGITRLVECGPGKVLRGLNRRIDRKLKTLPAETPEALDKALASPGRA